MDNKYEDMEEMSHYYPYGANIFGYIGIGYETFNLLKNFSFANCLNTIDAIGSTISLPYSIISIETKGNYEIYKENLEIKRYNMNNNLPADYGTINPRTGIRDYSSGFLFLIDK